MAGFWNLLGLLRALGDVVLDAALVWLIIVCGNAVRALIRLLTLSR